MDSEYTHAHHKHIYTRSQTNKHVHIHTATTQLGDSGNNDPETNYLRIALAAGIPCGVVIVVLTAVIVFMVCLTLRRSR